MLLLGAIGISRLYFDQSTSPVLLGGIECTGYEDAILNCNHTVLSDCPDQTVASVVCHCEKKNQTSKMTIVSSYFSIHIQQLLHHQVTAEMVICDWRME